MGSIGAITSVIVVLAVTVSCVNVEFQRSSGNADPFQIAALGSNRMAGSKWGEWRQASDADFAGGTQYKTRIFNGAVTLDNAREGTYTSEVKETDFQFNAVGVLRSARLPSGARVDLEIRTSIDSKVWSPWIAIQGNEATRGEKDDAKQIIAVRTARFIQYRAIFSAGSSIEQPSLDSVAIRYINSRAGPGLEETNIARLPKVAGQPTIISREEWGADESLRFARDGEEIWPAAYSKPEKIIIHQSMAPDDADGPATVRAIYYYQAATLGWGDIGYHYLIDKRGNIYEGRRGDGITGGHSYGHNDGSIGIAVLGEYGPGSPSDATRNSLSELLGWLADKYGIDPLGKSFFVDRELFNIVSHRDADDSSSQTTFLDEDLPYLRQTAYDRIPPSAVKIESPASGAYVSDMAAVKLSQEDKWPLVKADFFVDGQSMGAADLAAGPWQLDPGRLAEGQHTLKAVVTNILGKQSATTQTINTRKPPAITWYFAEGNTNPGFETDLILLNTNSGPANFAITTFDESGQLDRREARISPKSRLSVSINEVSPGKSVGIKVEADQIIYAERAIRFGHDGHTSTGTARLSPTWYFAEGSTENNFDTRLLVMNPNDSPATLDVTYFRPNGSVTTRSYVAGATSRLNILPKDDVPGTPLAMEIESDLPVVAERSMYFDGGRSGHDSVGAPAQSPIWYFAEGAGGRDFNTWLLLLNPNSTAASVNVTFYHENGRTELTKFAVGPRSRTNLWVNATIAAMAGNAVAMKVEADRPIVAERSMYWADGRAGHNRLGATALANRWFLPEGSTIGANEWLLILNPNVEAAKVTVTFLDDNGIVAIKAYQVPAHARFNILANQDVSSQAVSAIAQSDRPIVVERSSYTVDNLGGTNSLGIPRYDNQ